ncbi:MAG TPA: AAA family ATPase, partial [Caldimonas sp.]|nr:AAA family ATPase [Caldimonas sp.]
KPFALLCALARAPHTLITKDQLLDGVWGHQFVSDSVLKTTISDLRSALHDDPKRPRFIETVSRRGYRFIGTVSDVDIAPQPAMRADAPMPAPTSASASVPAPVSAPVPVGRAEVLAGLRAAWSLAEAGRRQLVWISGEAGVGKSTVIERFVREVGEARSAQGQCVEQYGHGEPYLAVLEALTGLCARDPAIVELIRAVAPTWLFQLPWLSGPDEREALRRELAGATQARMLREMAELIDRYTAQQPLLLVTEDMHWSDAATVQLMDYLARRRSGAHFMWLASFRLTELIAGEHPLATVRHELRLHGLGKEIVLEEFSEAEVGEYLRAHAPVLARDPALGRALHDRTDGLPLFVAGLVDDLVANSRDGSDPGARLAAMAIPETLSGVIERYVEELPAVQRPLLEAASVCGVQFRLPTLAQVLDVDTVAVADACADLARRHRWLRQMPQGGAAEAGYAFRHALYREVLYKRIDRLARIELHRKVATVLERERGQGANVSAAELASHFELAREPRAALRHYAEAAEAALLQFSPTHTLAFTERALALVPQVERDAERTRLEVSVCALRGTAAMQSIGISSVEVREAFERALEGLGEVPDHPLRVLILSVLGVACYLRGEGARATAVAQRSEALWNATGDRSAFVCACLVHGLLESDAGRPVEACEWLQKGIDALEKVDAVVPPAVFAADAGVMLLGMCALELQCRGLVDQARAHIRAASERAIALGQPAPRQAAWWAEALLAVRMGDAERAADAAERLAALHDEYDGPEGRAAAVWIRGWAQARLGDPRAGHRLIRQGYDEMARIGTRAFAGETLGYAAEALLLDGDVAGARRELAEARTRAQEIDDRRSVPWLLLLEARVADALADGEGARAWLQQAIVEATHQQALWSELLARTALCERDDATADERAALGDLLDRLPECRDTPAAARARALLGRPLAAPA